MNRTKNFFKLCSIPLLLIIIMIGCTERSGLVTPSVVTTPTVSSTNPLNNATGVPFNQKISITFSEAMDSTTITTASITLMQGTSFVSGTVSITGPTATFAPSSLLAPNTVYTVTITTMAKNLDGRSLASNFILIFTTGASAAITLPEVTSTDPVNAATGVAFNQKIAASFSVAMDASTITASTFTVLQGTTPVAGFVSYSGTTALFAPSRNLLANTAYTVRITTGAKDLSGNALGVDYVFSFITGAAAVVTPPVVSSTDPANAALSVPFNQKIVAAFSKTMDASTITTATFTLMQGTNFVSGTVGYIGTTATFTPSSNLTANVVYTATITTGAKDLAGNALTANYVWSFTTGSAAVVTPPAVSLTDPINASVNVPFNQKVTATFSKALDASTITTATFTLMQGTTFVSGTVSYIGTTATYTPASNLSPNTTYTATITTGAKDLAGNSLAANYVWSFTTGAAAVITPPVVTSTDPLPGASNVALNQKIAASFSKTMDASTISTATFTLVQGTTPVAGFVSYSGTTATFAPSANLLPNTAYTATITTGSKDLTGNALAANYVWSFTTGAAPVITPPVVTSTDPANAATNVALNQKVAATFSKTMDASTITTATFTLLQGTTALAGFVSYSGTSATFTPTANLLPNTVYTVTITTGSKDLAGNALAANYVWSFTTGSLVIVTPPIVSSTDPLNAAIGVALDKKIAATFSKAMDASTITTATFTLTQGVVSISGFVSYSGTTAIFTPATNLTANTVYTATVTTGSKDLAGNALAANYVWSFTTGAAVVTNPPTVVSTDPADAATGVVLSKKVAATFSKAMDASTITTSTFTLMQGTTSVSGFVSYSGTTAVFAPATSLTANTVYTATITTGSKDLAGNALAANYVWSFTTGNSAVLNPPTVTSTDPLTAATGVALNKKISAVFSKTMDASTLTTASFTLMQGTTAVSGFVSYSGTTVTFAPLSNLASNTVYTATITTGAKDVAGDALATNYVWSFTTVVVVPPTVSSTDPSNAATGVPYNKKIAATFSKTMDASSITASTFTLMQGTTTVSGFVSYSGTTAIFTPENELTPNKVYTATITTGATDLLGTPLANNYVWSFTTALTIAPDLGGAASFGSFGGSAGITNQGIYTVINGDIGTTAASTLITGFHDSGGNVFTETPLNIGSVTGVINCAPPAPGNATKFAKAQQALLDATTAFNYLAGLPSGPDPGAGELGGLVLAPGTYTAAAGSFMITSDNLTLDAQNDPNAVWVFQMATSLTVGKAGLPRSIILINGAQAKNIFWQVSSAATINGTGGGTMAGTIISYSGVTFSTAGNVTLTVLNGRALSLHASVTMVNTVVNVPGQ